MARDQRLPVDIVLERLQIQGMVSDVLHGVRLLRALEVTLTRAIARSTASYRHKELLHYSRL